MVIFCFQEQKVTGGGRKEVVQLSADLFPRAGFSSSCPEAAGRWGHHHHKSAKSPFPPKLCIGEEQGLPWAFSFRLHPVGQGVAAALLHSVTCHVSRHDEPAGKPCLAKGSMASTLGQ